MSCEKYKFELKECEEGVIHLPRSIIGKAAVLRDTTLDEDGTKEYIFSEDIAKYILAHQADHTHEDGHKH